MGRNQQFFALSLEWTWQFLGSCYCCGVWMFRVIMSCRRHIPVTCFRWVKIEAQQTVVVCSSELPETIASPLQLFGWFFIRGYSSRSQLFGGSSNFRRQVCECLFWLTAAFSFEHFKPADSTLVGSVVLLLSSSSPQEDFDSITKILSLIAGKKVAAIGEKPGKICSWDTRRTVTQEELVYVCVENKLARSLDWLPSASGDHT